MKDSSVTSYQWFHTFKERCNKSNFHSRTFWTPDNNKLFPNKYDFLKNVYTNSLNETTCISLTKITLCISYLQCVPYICIYQVNGK